jgi:hypothetical protein
VVFFHGMGEQRHYESVAQMVQALDAWVFRCHRAKEPRFPSPRLRDIKTRRERLRGDRDQSGTVACMEARYEVAGETTPSRGRVRFYEAYWAPAASEGTTAREVAWWLLRQGLRPLSVVLSPWRHFERLRRADLVEMVGADGRDAEHVGSLVDRYRGFQAARSHPRGRFPDFLEHIRRVGKEAEPLLDLARRWRGYHVRREMTRLLALWFVLGSVASFLVLAGAALYRAFLALPGLLASAPGRWAPLKEYLEPTPANLTTLAVLVLSLSGVRRFLKSYFGDVQQFVTYQETEPRYERRRKILDSAVGTLKHVLADTRCDRVVVAAHSLGSAVALDALLELRGHNIAHGGSDPLRGPLPLRKVQHFVTFGSPIDKINYFFAVQRSRYWTYDSLVETLRGDIGEVPFSQVGRQPWVHWINFWDRGDPISGSIETLNGAHLRVQRVDNVQVASYAWPSPQLSHGAYLDRAVVMKTLFDAAFRNGLSFADPSRDAEGRPRWGWLGPGRGSPLQTALMLAFIAGLAALLALSVWELLSGQGLLFRASLLGLLAVLLGGGWIQERFGLHLPDEAVDNAPTPEPAPPPTPPA